jgi:hypothetical protein
MAKYIVNVIMSSCVEIAIEANNEEEAQILALEEAEISMADDWDYEVDCVYRDGDDDDEDEEEEEEEDE